VSDTRSFEIPDVFTVGAIGEPGRRLFLLQGGDVGDLVTIKVEKAQLIGLTSGLARAVAQLSRPGELAGTAPLSQPHIPEWVAGEIRVAVDTTDELIEVVITEFADEDPASVRFVLSKEQAAQFAITATRLVEQGRPPCPLCGYPLDPEQHACPRTNGHRAPAL
jgi:uncharacterized repeat protein (TIGR03847 family)